MNSAIKTTALKIKILSLLALLTVPLSSFCQEWKKFDWKFTDSGLRYYVVDSGNSNVMQKGDSVAIHFIWYAEKDKSKLFSTYDEKIGLQMLIVGNNYYVKGFQEAITLLREKGKGFFVIPPSLAYGDEGMQGEKAMYYYIEIVGMKHN